MSESKPAGMFRGKDIVPKEKGVYLIRVEKLKSDPHPEYGNDRFSNGFWDGEKWQVYFTFHEWLDESPASIAEARQDVLIDRLKINIEELQDLYDTARADQGALAHEKKRLTADLTAMKEKFYGLLGSAKIAADLLRSDKPATGKALDVLIPRIAACETGGQNGKE